MSQVITQPPSCEIRFKQKWNMKVVKDAKGSGKYWISLGSLMLAADVALSALEIWHDDELAWSTILQLGLWGILGLLMILRFTLPKWYNKLMPKGAYMAKEQNVFYITEEMLYFNALDPHEQVNLRFDELASCEIRLHDVRFCKTDGEVVFANCLHFVPELKYEVQDWIKAACEFHGIQVAVTELSQRIRAKKNGPLPEAVPQKIS